MDEDSPRSTGRTERLQSGIDRKRTTTLLETSPLRVKNDSSLERSRRLGSQAQCWRRPHGDVPFGDLLDEKGERLKSREPAVGHPGVACPLSSSKSGRQSASSSSTVRRFSGPIRHDPDAGRADRNEKTDDQYRNQQRIRHEKEGSVQVVREITPSRPGIATAGRTLGREGTWPAETFNRVIQINLCGSYNVTKEAAAVMQLNDANEEGERGVVISTASVAAFEGQIGQAAYSASKGGVVGMMLPLAREFAQFGIRVNTIAPGIFLTPMMAGMPEDVQESLGRQIPFPPRLGRPEEYADTAAFIYGNPVVNGETIRIDGAIRMQPK